MIAANFLPQLEVKPSGCVEWTGHTVASGTRKRHHYGCLKVNGKRVLAHRYAYTVHCGPIPDGMLVCHRCDNTLCCNPDHLFLGTHRENMADMTAKGRRAGIARLSAARGERTACAKLTEASVLEIRAERAKGVTTVALASRFGVSNSVISRAATGKTWSHI